GISHHGSPDSAVGWAEAHGIDVHQDALVLRGIDRLIGSDKSVPFTVAVSVDDEWRPSLRLHFVARFVKYLPVQPTKDSGAPDSGTRPQRLIRVFAEVQMVSLEAGADESEFSSCRIVHREMAIGFLDRQYFRRRMSGSLLAHGRIFF